MNERWTFFIETFGCKINQYESQQIRELWLAKNGREVSNAESADYILINSCAITANAERDARNAVYRIKKKAPNAKLILSGCAAQFFSTPKPLQKDVKPDLCIWQKDKKKLFAGPPFLDEAVNNLSASPPAISFFKRSRPVIKIQDGCSHNCAYCVVPQTRGKPESRRYAEIFNECAALLEGGYFELILSGVNLAQYGIGLSEKKDFWEMTDRLIVDLRKNFSGNFRIRLSSLDPALISEKALAVLGKNPEICPHLHLSIQHASPSILKNMHRSHYSRESILNSMDKVKKIWPLFGLGADIITGFPNESRADFLLLQEFIKELDLTYAHIFPFSARANTIAANLPNQIPYEIKKERAKLIRKIVHEKSQDFLQKQLKLPFVTIVPKKVSETGINEYYTSCKIFKTDAMRKVPAKIMAIPKLVHENQLLCETISREGLNPESSDPANIPF